MLTAIQRLQYLFSGSRMDRPAIRSTAPGAVPARFRLPDRSLRELHTAQQETGPDDLLVEGTGRHESRLRAWHVQLDRRDQDERRDPGPGYRKAPPTWLG